MEEILHELIGRLSHCLEGLLDLRWLARFRPSTVGIGSLGGYPSILFHVSHEQKKTLTFHSTGCKKSGSLVDVYAKLHT